MKNYTTCKASPQGAVRGSKYYAFATTMPDGTVVESAEVVSRQLDKPKGRRATKNMFLKMEARSKWLDQAFETNFA